MSPPPFANEPSLAALKSQASELQAAIARYEAASNEKSKALDAISAASQRLTKSSMSPGAAMAQLVFQPQACAAVRVAVGMGLFDQLVPGQPASAEALASRCKSERDFTNRIARAVASTGVLQEVSEETYTHTGLSMMLRDETAKSSLAHMFDTVAVTMFHLNDFFQEYGYKTPTDVKNTPTVFAQREKDLTYFEWLTKHPEKYSVFNKAMSFHTMSGVDGIANAYPWNQLPEGNNGIRVIDIGGGKGHVLKTIIGKHPEFFGHVALEDLGNVLLDDSLVTSEAATKQSYNFLEEEQPIIGASAYYFRHVLCDWPDEMVVKILRSQLQAMKGYDSRLLISDLVLPNHGVDRLKAMRDINMMQLSGVERSEKQWHALLDQAGFRILNILNKNDPNNSIIEAVPKEL